ncbi:hypothetical protein D3C84_642680 [compost metagenome]
MTVDFCIRLHQVATGGLNQHTLFGKVPVAILGAVGVASRFALNFVERKIQPRKIQQTALAAALRPHHQVPRQFAAPAFTMVTIQTRCTQSFQRFGEACLQLCLFIFDQRRSADTVVTTLGFFNVFPARNGATTDKNHAQPPKQKQHADGHQARGCFLPNLVIIDRKKWPDEPHQLHQKQHQQQGPDPGLPKQYTGFLQELFHHTSLFMAPALRPQKQAGTPAK